ALAALPAAVVRRSELRAVRPALDVPPAQISLDDLLGGPGVAGHQQIALRKAVTADHELDVRVVPQDAHVSAPQGVTGTPAGRLAADHDVPGATRDLDAAAL